MRANEEQEAPTAPRRIKNKKYAGGFLRSVCYLGRTSPTKTAHEPQYFDFPVHRTPADCYL